jgi:predicted membrane channel-forming protein YqfA (hemolysin III family)
VKLPEFKPTPWNLLYLSAGVCLLICFATIYQIAQKQDASSEWIVWLFVILGFFLFAGGYVYEYRYKKDHPDEYPDFP